MVDGGRDRMAGMMQRNEDAGQSSSNPYASAVFRRFVLPLADLIDEDLTRTGAGKRGAWIALMQGLDAQAVAYIAIRHTLNMALTYEGDARQVAIAVGRAVYSELVLTLFENIEPKLYHYLVKMLEGRMSKSERYKMVIFKQQAKKMNIELPEWGIAGVVQVGSYLLDLMEELGFIETNKVRKPKLGGKGWRDENQMSFTPETLGLIDQIKDFMLDVAPIVGPCVERPHDWVGVGDGGWHTQGMKRFQPFAIKTEGSWSELSDYDIQTPLAAINALQSVKWQVNNQMLLAVKEIARYFDTDEIIGTSDRFEQTRPAKPFWLTDDMKKAQMSPEEQDEFLAWRRAMADWFTEQKQRGTKYGRFNQALRMAEKMQPYPELFFVYFADFRGRLYAQSTGISPQGSDLQKALLRFAIGKPLSSPAAVKWFKVNGANKFGFDKATLEDRAAWVDERHDLIRAIASDPLSTRKEWGEADCPMQFLAWCFEYKRWSDEPSRFVSHLPVGMDGSCNGLQNFSAMLRDEVGGKATNLLPGLRPNDIYQMVADTAAQMLRDEGDKEIPEEDGTEATAKSIAYFTAENRFRRMWLRHGLSRGLVKRSVMTKPYGSTRFSCADFIVEDYLRQGKAPEIAKEDYHPAARYLSRYVWRAISEVVIKADEAMTWLQQASRLILKEYDHIRWVTPTGFPVIQRYQKREEVRVRTRLCGNARLAISQFTNLPDKIAHANGIAPNFIHSQDSSHMALVALAGWAEGMSLAMIHDDFGTHAADAERLFVIIRETFVNMYENDDPLKRLAEYYDLPSPPDMGRLDLRQVLSSPYFFS